jgi:3-methyladenine DNA glycosylase AlkD
MKSTAYVKALCALYRSQGDASAAAGAKAYMRGQFDYFGLSTPQRRELSKAFMRRHGQPAAEQLAPLVKMLWEKPQRECQYFAMEMLEKRTGELNDKDIFHIEYMITAKSWWDTVDFISPKIAGPFLAQRPALIHPTAKRWMGSGHTWLMRSALLFQTKYRKQTDEKLLYSLIRSCMHEKEFFIRKAIGWALSEHSKTFPASVKKFVKEHDGRLSPLSKKEALRQFR